MGVKAPLLTYFGEPQQTHKINQFLNENLARIQINRLIGSSFAITASAVVRKSTKPNLFIFRAKEQATYFINDMEGLLKDEVFFFPHHTEEPTKLKRPITLMFCLEWKY